MKPRRLKQLVLSGKSASAPDNGATLRAVRIRIIQDAWERVQKRMGAQK
jgi:hypothetical protein